MGTEIERLTLTVPEVAALLRISRGAAYEAVRTGTLPGVLHFGRTIRISRHAIEQLLQCPESYQTAMPLAKQMPLQRLPERTEARTR